MSISSTFLNNIDKISYDNDHKAYFEFISEAGNKVNSSPLPSLFHPAIINSQELDTLKEQTEQMASILNKTIDLYINNNEVQSFFQFPEKMNSWITSDVPYDIKIPISRYDGFWCGEKISFCEFNTDGTSGMDEINILDEAFLRTHAGKKLSKDLNLINFDLRLATLEILLECYRSYGGKKDKPNIAITDFLEIGTYAEFKSLMNFFTKNGYRTEICDIRKLKFKKDGLWHNNFKIDIVYRRAVTDEMYLRKDDFKDFMSAYSTGSICVVGSLRTQIAHSKLIFTFLSSPKAEKYFTKAEYEYLRKHIPWTRLLNYKAADKIVNNKDSYFIKPHNAYGCKGVYCGSDMNQEAWEKIINELLMKNDNSYLVQERINIPTDLFITGPAMQKKEFKVNVGPFVFNGRLKGFYTRISSNNVITTNKKALLLPFLYIR